MSGRFGLTYSRVIVSAFGIILLALGGTLTYQSLTVVGVPTWFFTSLGFIVAILGVFLLLSKDA